MKTLRLLVAALLAIMTAAGIVPASSHAQTPSSGRSYDLGADFSIKRNPNRPWLYGYSTTRSLELKDFRRDRRRDSSSPVAYWHPLSSVAGKKGYYPYVAGNTTDATQLDRSGGWAVRAGEVAMEAGAEGEFSLVRFITPKTALYQINARFSGIHFALSTTDVHVLLNGTELFAAEIDGYGGDPAFHAIAGSQPNASYSGMLRLKARDILTFAVGFGQNQTHFGDTTGLSATVVELAE